MYCDLLETLDFMLIKRSGQFWIHFYWIVCSCVVLCVNRDIISYESVRKIFVNHSFLLVFSQACSPTEQVKVHRVVLSANSPYFRSILSSYSNHPHPIIILQDVRFSVLKLLVTFMYRFVYNSFKFSFFLYTHIHR